MAWPGLSPPAEYGLWISLVNFCSGVFSLITYGCLSWTPISHLLTLCNKILQKLSTNTRLRLYDTLPNGRRDRLSLLLRLSIVSLHCYIECLSLHWLLSNSTVWGSVLRVHWELWESESISVCYIAKSKGRLMIFAWKCACSHFQISQTKQDKNAKNSW